MEKFSNSNVGKALFVVSRLYVLTEVTHKDWFLHEGHPSLLTETNVFTLPRLNNIQDDILQHFVFRMHILAEGLWRCLPNDSFLSAFLGMLLEGNWELVRERRQDTDSLGYSSFSSWGFGCLKEKLLT